MTKKPKYDPDVCASCQWAEPENMDLKPCTSCGRPTCKECRTKDLARCGYCASYDFPKRVKIQLEDGYYEADVHVGVTKYDGIGIHYYVVVEQNRRKVEKGKEPWYDTGRTMKAHRIKDIILKSIRARFPKGHAVTVYFKENRTRRWFYREGD